jgi:hypothetical protein
VLVALLLLEMPSHWLLVLPLLPPAHSAAHDERVMTRRLCQACW